MRLNRSAGIVVAGCLLWAVVACTGCASKPTTAHSWGEIVDESWRIVIDSRGGARVDVIWSIGPSSNEETVSHTVFVPCDQEEAARFVRAMHALIERSAIAPRSSLHDEYCLMEGPDYLAYKRSLQLRCQSGPTVRSTRVLSVVTDVNLILKGLIDEAKAIAHYPLAYGVVDSVQAEELARRNQWDLASNHWKYAWRSADDWYKLMSERKPEMGYSSESVTGILIPALNPKEVQQFDEARDKYRAAVSALYEAEESMSKWSLHRKNWRVSFSDPIAVFIPTLEHDLWLDPRQKLKMRHRNEWNRLIDSAAVLDTDGDTTTVRFTPGTVCSYGKTAYPPEAIPPDCLEFLKAAVWERAQREEKGK